MTKTKRVIYLTFDIEPYWVAVPAQHGTNAWTDASDNSHGIFYEILQACKELNLRATFFFVGKWAEKYPKAVRDAHELGHNIGSHSMSHDDMRTLTDAELLEDLIRSRMILEEITGSRVIHFRAPSFSLKPEQLPLIKEAGYEYDSSCTSALRIHGGKNHYTNSDKSPVRFVLQGMSLFGIELTILGGGYLRLIPTWLLKKLFRYDIGNMIYLHPIDFERNYYWYNFLSVGANVRKNIRMGNTQRKLFELAKHYDLQPLSQL